MRRLMTLAFCAAVALQVACDSPRSAPFAPFVNIPAPGPLEPPRASLELSNLSAEPTYVGNVAWWYAVKFRVRETTAQSGAVVTSVSVSDEATNVEIVGQECWRREIRVDAGGTQDVFDTGWRGLSYCAPGISSEKGLSRILVSVTFRDDSGAWGIVTAEIRISGIASQAAGDPLGRRISSFLVPPA